MASIVKRPNGTRQIRWVAGDGRRKQIVLGKVTVKESQTIRPHVEALIFANQRGTTPKQSTAEWLSELGEPLYGRLIRAGLVAPRPGDNDDGSAGPKTLGELWDWFLQVHGQGAKPRTLFVWKHSRQSAERYFKPSKPIVDITKGDADAFVKNIATAPRSKSDKRPLAPNTYRKRLSVCRQVFRQAVRNRWLDENPFGDLKGLAVRADKSKQYFVTRAEAEKVLEACPNAEWRLIFALARYGGLRAPSEALALRWSDILWDKNRMRVTSPKTAHHEGKGERIVPLFPELAGTLSEAFDLAPEGAEFVVTKTRDAGANWRTTFGKIVTRAGLKPWPRLIANLRASRATELEETFPGHVVRSWLGHSESIAREFYLQTTDEHFEKAVTPSASVHPKVHQSVADRSRNAPTVVYSENPVGYKEVKNTDFSRVLYTEQYTRRDSNPQPSVPKTDALSN